MLAQMETSKKIRSFKYKYLELSNKLSNIELNLKEANVKLKKLKEMQSKIDRGEKLTGDEIKMIRLSENTPSFMIRFRLNAEIKHICEDIKRYESEHALTTQAMNDLKVCPECGGIGLRKEKMEYVRLEEGVIIPSFESVCCEFCEGKGTIDFREIEESLKIPECEAVEGDITKKVKPKTNPKRALEEKEFKEEA
jgi:hypothetical protein